MTLSIKIYHNPRCSKSRQSLDILVESASDHEIVEYLKNPPNMGEISNLLDKLGFDDPRALMRKGEAIYKELGLADNSKSKDDLIKAMSENPILIERPIIVTKKGVRIGRPPEAIKEIL